MAALKVQNSTPYPFELLCLETPQKLERGIKVFPLSPLTRKHVDFWSLLKVSNIVVRHIAFANLRKGAQQKFRKPIFFTQSQIFSSKGTQKVAIWRLVLVSAISLARAIRGTQCYFELWEAAILDRLNLGGYLRHCSSLKKTFKMMY